MSEDYAGWTSRKIRRFWNEPASRSTIIGGSLACCSWIIPTGQQGLNFYLLLWIAQFPLFVSWLLGIALTSTETHVINPTILIDNTNNEVKCNDNSNASHIVCDIHWNSNKYCNQNNHAIRTLMTKMTLKSPISLRLPVSIPATSSSQCPVTGGCRRPLGDFPERFWYEKWNISQIDGSHVYMYIYNVCIYIYIFIHITYIYIYYIYICIYIYTCNIYIYYIYITYIYITCIYIYV